MKQTQKKYLFINCFFACILLASCNNYYKVIHARAGTDNLKAKSIDSLKKANRTFIIRNGEKAFIASRLSVNTSGSEIACSLDTVPIFHKLHLIKRKHGNMRYYKNNLSDLDVLTQVHIYVAQDNMVDTGNNSIPLNKIQQIEVIEKDRSRTNSSHLLGGLGITAAILLITGIIVAANFTLHLGG